MALPFILILVRLLNIIPNYFRARSLNLPIYVSLITWQNPIWTLVHSYFLWLSNIPFPPFNGIKYSYLGWANDDKGRTHVEVGDAFCVVSPYRLEIFCAEPSVCLELAQKWKVWTKAPEVYGKSLRFSEYSSRDLKPRLESHIIETLSSTVCILPQHPPCPLPAPRRTLLSRVD